MALSCGAQPGRSDDFLASELAWRAIFQWIEALPHPGSVAHGLPHDWVPRG